MVTTYIPKIDPLGPERMLVHKQSLIRAEKNNYKAAEDGFKLFKERVEQNPEDAISPRFMFEFAKLMQTANATINDIVKAYVKPDTSVKKMSSDQSSAPLYEELLKGLPED